MKLLITNEQEREELILTLKNMDVSAEKPLKVEYKRSNRSLSQNALYWVWMTFIAKHWTDDFDNAPEIIDTRRDGTSRYVPYDKDVCHDYFAQWLLPAEKRQFNYLIQGEQKTKTRMVTESTSKLCSREMSEYMMKIRQVCLNVWGIVLETPEEAEFTKYLRSLDSV